MNTFDEIIQTKAYGDLSPAELEVVGELISSEQEYNEMKAFYTGISHLSISAREEIAPSVKSSLNAVFQAKHPGIQQNWSAPAHEAEEKKVVPLYNRGWFRAAAVLVVSSGIATIWFIGSENQLSEKKEPVQLAKLEQDTLESEVTQKAKDSSVSIQTEQSSPVVNGSVSANASSSATYQVQANATQGSTATYSWTESLADRSAETHDQITPAASGTYYSYTLSAANSKSTTVMSNGILSKKPEKAKKAESVGNKGFSGSFGETALVKQEKENQTSLSKAGLDADLNPLGTGYLSSNFGRKAEQAEMPKISTNDLLSLIEPSF